MPARHKPTQLKLMTGSDERYINRNEPVAVDVLPILPNVPEVPVEVEQIWNYTLAHLDKMKLASAADRDQLYAYCWAVYTHRLAGQMLSESALLVLGPSGNHVPNPALRIQRDAAATMRSFAQEFGLTPSARAGISIGGGDGKGDDNPFGDDGS